VQTSSAGKVVVGGVVGSVVVVVDGSAGVAVVVGDGVVVGGLVVPTGGALRRISYRLLLPSMKLLPTVEPELEIVPESTEVDAAIVLHDYTVESLINSINW